MNTEDAVKALKKGGIVAIPTESSYGLACDPFNEKAVRKLHELKKEPMDKPVLLLVATRQMIQEIAELTPQTELLIEKFMPGPLTLLAKKKRSVPDLISKEKVAFRIPDNKIAIEISKKFGKPITGTSANLHGEKPAFSPEEVRKYFGKDFSIVDGGKLEENAPSTIYDAEEKKVIRKGPISEAELKKALEA